MNSRELNGIWTGWVILCKNEMAVTRRRREDMEHRGRVTYAVIRQLRGAK